MNARVSHFEIPADDLKRAQDFYGKAFGWQLNPFQGIPGMEYVMVGTTPSDDNGMPTEPGAINGGMAKRGMPLQALSVAISVDDIDATLQNVEKLGGKTVQKKMPVGDMGFTAYFKDTEGNVLGLWQNAQM